MNGAIIALAILGAAFFVCFDQLPKMARKSWSGCIGALLILGAVLTVLFFLSIGLMR